MPKDVSVSPETLLSVRRTDHGRLKRFAKKHGITMTEAFGDLIAKMEVKKVETVEPKSKEIELAVCDECEEEVPIDASFCPYCGAEFEEEDEDESEEESED
jgi:rRNA maturation endonuclease Nob1